MNYHYHQHHNFCLGAIENIGRASANLNYWPRKKILMLMPCSPFSVSMFFLYDPLFVPLSP